MNHRKRNFRNLLLCGGLILAGFVLMEWLIVWSQPYDRDPTKRGTTKNSPKQVGIALYNYHDEHEIFPPGGFFDEDGNGNHGWQTSLLPQIDQGPLYNKIEFDHLWNATENQEVFQTKIPLYRGGYDLELRKYDERAGDNQGYPHTLFAANSRLFSKNTAMSFRDISDGLEHTIFAGEVAGDYLPWGIPEIGEIPPNASIKPTTHLARRIAIGVSC